MIDPEADRPIYKQLLDLVRGQIERGELVPGQRIPTEQDYVQRHGISRDSVRRAMATLRADGLIVTTARGSIVRLQQDKDEVVMHPVARVTSRMPTTEERRRFGLLEGVPVLVVERADGDTEVFPADRTTLVFE
jgi:DNA-binding GntR family transcriptional regulator